MPVYTLTARVLDGSGQVRAVKRAPFLVCGEGEDLQQALADLEQAAREIEAAAGDIAAAEHDATHRHHHWWLP
jgi:hypothetical protein